MDYTEILNTISGQLATIILGTTVIAFFIGFVAGGIIANQFSFWKW